jgi:hypothetical protein
MQWLFGILITITLLILGAISRYYWRRYRAFGAEITIETLRLWREYIEDYRKRHPEEKAPIGVAEAAVQMALHSEHKNIMLAKAWENVKMMRTYLVQECGPDSRIGWQEILATSEQDAAEKVCCTKLDVSGTLGELRARVRLKRNPMPAVATAFYKRQI